jgi:hypothetical protein
MSWHNSPNDFAFIGLLPHNAYLMKGVVALPLMIESMP